MDIYCNVLRIVYSIYAIHSMKKAFEFVEWHVYNFFFTWKHSWLRCEVLLRVHLRSMWMWMDGKMSYKWAHQTHKHMSFKWPLDCRLQCNETKCDGIVTIVSGQWQRIFYLLILKHLSTFICGLQNLVIFHARLNFLSSSFRYFEIQKRWIDHIFSLITNVFVTYTVCESLLFRFKIYKKKMTINGFYDPI